MTTEAAVSLPPETDSAIPKDDAVLQDVVDLMDQALALLDSLKDERTATCMLSHARELIAGELVIPGDASGDIDFSDREAILAYFRRLAP